jgi:TolB-like protein
MSDHQRVSPSVEDVRTALERVLASEAFANTGRLARLLRYVVERSLAGEGDQLKEYVLGVEVFDRGEQYDPRLDSIVRVEARRLRAKLDEYYQNGGAGEAVVIAIPRGTYAPVFTVRRVEANAPGGSALPIDSAFPIQEPGIDRRAVLGLAMAAIAAVAAASWVAFRSTAAAQPKPSLAVLPFEQHTGTEGDERLAARITDAVTSELARLGSVSVVSRTSARQFEGSRTPLRIIAQTLGADLVMESTLETSSDRLRVTARLVNAATDRKVWVEEFEAPTADVAALASRIAASAAQAATTRQ